MSGVHLAYQWYLDGEPVAGAIGTSYTPTTGDLGRTVHLDITGSRAGYPTVTRSSAETAPVNVGILTPARPTINGTPKVGRTLTAKPGAWSPKPTFSYTWLADGKPIKHQIGSTLRLTKAQKGRRISVKVTGTKAGYATKSPPPQRAPPKCADSDHAHRDSRQPGVLFDLFDFQGARVTAVSGVDLGIPFWIGRCIHKADPCGNNN
jgi:hypothetical protein